ncbi:N-acetylmuramoyl-L-alanine amidase [Flavobacterium sp. LB2P84]|jgi:N-acetylmuramoyl-L-alanine amidase|uniref:N-acetylmuramoyl-L-alanine amidase n=1 Tax=Flavobacterium yafengii TaxID=3041253 RepID=A0AAW6TKQ6_9FLAO|nr:N-acetylmuramoyl-L-alanine amidase [Flavobacterium yafengii]MDI5897044.1 N-acetylmuramoyl-L-alanine amidase [Flavobacterium yafengii]MDI5949999.1 N-acetylmuramoyl-L-alanine amidase [Flavobacterium yafengii]MDI6033935.1 N-acetylmuramoyl-L-alanine amidase [Flavobacterium yafengii]
MRITYKIKIILTFILTIVSLSSFSQSNVFKVTLDAGHGAHDFGAVYEGRVEKNIALAVVLKVGKLLESTKQMDVNYTRKTDVFIDLIERANIANRFNATIFVSIHCNANRNTAADGTETYVMGLSKVASNLEAAKKENSVITLEKDYKQKYEGFDPNSPETMIGMTLMQEEYLDNSISLASKVEDSFADLGKKIRGGGVKQAPFMVLHKAYMPRVLIEMGFISNSIEGNILNSEDGQNEIAKAIADAIISYKKEYFGNGETEIFEELPSQKINEKPIRDTVTPAKPKMMSQPAQESTQVKKTIDNAKPLFKVQLSATSKRLELVPKNFNGLKNISVAYENRVYKYMYGETADYDEAKKQLSEAKEKGYDTAFLIAFKNGEKVNIQDVIK